MPKQPKTEQEPDTIGKRHPGSETEDPVDDSTEPQKASVRRGEKPTKSPTRKN